MSRGVSAAGPPVTIETYIHAVTNALVWAEPPVAMRPQNMDIDTYRATIHHAWSVVANAARNNVTKAQRPAKRKAKAVAKRPRKAVAKRPVKRKR